MWATPHAFAHNNLNGTTLIPAPKYGHDPTSIMGAIARYSVTVTKN